MPRTRPRHLYSLFVTSYASPEIKDRVEQGKEVLTQMEQIEVKLVHLQTESQAGTAFYRAVKKAMKNPLARHVTVTRDGKDILAHVRIERKWG